MNALRFALRRLARSPGFAASALLILALGIGFCVSCFSIANAFLLRDLPYPDADRLVRIYRTTPQAAALGHSPANFADITAAATSFGAIAGYNTPHGTLIEGDRLPEAVWTIGATPNFFGVLGVRPVLGRGFTDADAEYGRPGSIVLTQRGWDRLFGRDPAVLGRTVQLDARGCTIIGVLPPEFDAPMIWRAADLVVVYQWSPATRTRRSGGFMHAVGRLKPGVGLAQAQSELTSIMGRLVQQYPKENVGVGVFVTPLHDSEVPDTSRVLLWLMAGLAMLMLLIACANLAGLQVTRAFRRSREYAVRAALGANRRQLMVPLLVENLTLSAAGGLLGLLVALWCNDSVGRRIPMWGEQGFALPIDFRVFGFAAATAIGCGLAFGLGPALFASRSLSADALKDASRSATPGRAQQQLKRILIAGQLALALALVGVATSLGIGLRTFTHRSLGWEPDGLLAAMVMLPPQRYPQADFTRNAAFQRAMLERLASIPGADHAAMTWSLPIFQLSGRTDGVIAEGQPPTEPGHEPAVEVTVVSTDFFATLRIPFRQGATFQRDLKHDDPPVGVINRSLAERLWPGENPVGRRFRFAANNGLPGPGGGIRDAGQWVEVVGVVNDVLMATRTTAPATPLQLYLPTIQRGGAHLMMVLRTSLEPESLAPAVRQAVASVDPAMAVTQHWTARTAVDNRLADLRLVVSHLGVSAGMGLVIAAIGLFSVLAQMGAQRTREIGVRIALGAQRIDIARMILGEAGRALTLGVAAGLLLLLPLVRIAHTAVPALEFPGGWLWLANIILLVGVGLLACWLPARRAAQVDPAVALRAE